MNNDQNILDLCKYRFQQANCIHLQKIIATRQSNRPKPLFSEYWTILKAYPWNNIWSAKDNKYRQIMILGYKGNKNT